MPVSDLGTPIAPVFLLRINKMRALFGRALPAGIGSTFLFLGAVDPRPSSDASVASQQPRCAVESSDRPILHCEVLQRRMANVW